MRACACVCAYVRVCVCTSFNVGHSILTTEPKELIFHMCLLLER